MLALEKSNTTTAESTEGRGVKQPEGTFNAIFGAETKRAAMLSMP
jgi:hypothetical protein